MTCVQGENPYIDRLPKITVADAKGSWPLFLEKMFGSPAKNNNTLLNPIPQTVYYHYWDNWTRRGVKAKAKREDLEEDYDRAFKAVTEANPKSAKEALELTRNLMRTTKRYVDLERVYAGTHRLAVLENFEGIVESLVMSVKEKKGTLSRGPRCADISDTLQIRQAGSSREWLASLISSRTPRR